MLKQSAAAFSLLFVVLGLVGTTLSVSEINYVEDSFSADDEVVIAFNVDGTGETLHAEIDSSQLSQALEGHEATRDVEISVDKTEAYAEYETRDENLEDLYAVDIVHERFDTEAERDDFADSVCRDEFDVYKDRYATTGFGSEYSAPWVYDVLCAKYDAVEPVYEVGQIQQPADDIFEATWTVDVEGEPVETVTLGNQQASEGHTETVSDDVRISFVSLRDLGSQSPDPVNTLAAASNEDGWRLINENNYQDYSQTRVSDVNSELSDFDWNYGSVNPDESDDIVQDYEEDLNEAYYNARVEYTNSQIHGATETTGTTSIEDGKLRYTPGSTYEWFTSEFQVAIDGEFVGVEKQIAEPAITNVVSGADVDGLKDGTAEIEVTNQGTGQGTFNMYASCDSGFSSVGTSDLVSLDPGETTTAYATITASGDEPLTGSCEFTVEDIETGESDTASFDTSYEPEQSCSPGTQDVIVDDGVDEIIECNEEGTGFETVEVCAEDEIAEFQTDGYECVEQDVGGEPPGGTPGEELGECEVELFDLPGFDTVTVTNPVCVVQNAMEDFARGATGFVGFTTTMLGVIVGGVVGLYSMILGYGFGRYKLPDQAGVRDDRLRLVFGIIGLVIGLMAGVLVYSLVSNVWVLLVLFLTLLVFLYTGSWRSLLSWVLR